MDFEKARFNMIEQQIRPWDVLDQSVLDLLQLVKREQFVPQEHRQLAFTDTDIALTQAGASKGEVIFSPKLDARVLQELKIKKSDRVLEIGTGSGYMAALLTKMAAHVVSLEINPVLAQTAKANLAAAGFLSTELVLADANTWTDNSTFDVIVLSGSVGVLSDAWLDRLNVGGRLSAYVGSAPVMQARIYQRGNEGPAIHKTIFETNVPRLHGFAEPKKFVF
jgi:protein-L-isoaspartate(D-aspartate) O-methyltransferase